MHYGDKKQLKIQKVLVTVYKDQFIDETKFTDRDISIRIETIVEARYVPTHSMCQLHYNIEHILRKEIPNMKDDVIYLVQLKTDGWDWKVIKLIEVTDKMLKKNPALGLH